jgi:hypothetical protein
MNASLRQQGDRVNRTPSLHTFSRHTLKDCHSGDRYAFPGWRHVKEQAPVSPGEQKA